MINKDDNENHRSLDHDNVFVKCDKDNYETLLIYLHDLPIKRVVFVLVIEITPFLA